LDSVKEYPATLKVLVLARNNYDESALCSAIERGKIKAFSTLLDELKNQLDTLKLF